MWWVVAGRGLACGARNACYDVITVITPADTPSDNSCLLSGSRLIMAQYHIMVVTSYPSDHNTQYLPSPAPGTRHRPAAPCVRTMHCPLLAGGAASRASNEG